MSNNDFDTWVNSEVAKRVKGLVVLGTQLAETFITNAVTQATTQAKTAAKKVRPGDRIQYYDDGTSPPSWRIDEIVCNDVMVHLEMLSDRTAYMNIFDPEDKEVMITVNFYTKGKKLYIVAEDNWNWDKISTPQRHTMET
jgi:hypothetical protein